MAQIKIGKQNDSTVFAGTMGSVSATTSTLPSDRFLGETRVENGVHYFLAYNAGNSAINPGYGVCSTQTAGALPYSVTVTTVTESAAGLKGVNNNATAATGDYFWCAYKGFPVRLVASNISLYTGTIVGPAAAGKFVTTDGTASIIGINVGDMASATATTDAVPTNGRFWVDFTRLDQIY